MLAVDGNIGKHGYGQFHFKWRLYMQVARLFNYLMDRSLKDVCLLQNAMRKTCKPRTFVSGTQADNLADMFKKAK